jgi:hypothetical protein
LEMEVKDLREKEIAPGSPKLSTAEEKKDKT